MLAYPRKKLIQVHKFKFSSLETATKSDVAEHPHHGRVLQSDITGADDFLMDIDIQNTVQKPNYKDWSRDVDYFFTLMYKAGKSFETAKHACESCPACDPCHPLMKTIRKKSPGCPVALIADVTTLRWHIESSHKVYNLIFCSSM